MPRLEFESSHKKNFTEIDSPATDEIKELLESLQNSHELRAKLMNLEAWALAETMDNFLPGFWNRFLENRRTALQQFLKLKRSLREQAGGKFASPTETIDEKKAIE